MLPGDSFRPGRVGGSRILVARLAKWRCHALEGDRIENPVEKPSKPFDENAWHAHGRITHATEPHRCLISAPRRCLPAGQGMMNDGDVFDQPPAACRVGGIRRPVGGFKRMPGGRMERATKYAYEPLSGQWSKSCVNVTIEDEPFDAGAMRTAVRVPLCPRTTTGNTLRLPILLISLALMIPTRAFILCPCMQHRMHEVEGGHRAMFVAKFYKVPVSKSDVLEDAKLSMVAETYAHDFNRKSGLDKKVNLLLQPLSSHAPSSVDVPNANCPGTQAEQSVAS